MHHPRERKTPLVVDEKVNLKINGSTQQIRMRAERTGLPPLLIVQYGPGFPLLHEATKFRRRLQLETDFLVSYWDQRGCGVASQRDAKGVSLQQQVDDLRAVLQWLHDKTRQKVILFGISLGATITLQAAEHEADKAKAVVAISPDSDTADSDASVHSFLQTHAALANGSRLTAKLKKLGEPPYTDPGAIQRRAGLMADLGAIEHGRTFSALLRETLWGMFRTYGVVGTARAMRNMNLIQGRMLPQLVSLNLLANPPRLAVPVHYVFGEQDPLVTAALIEQVPAAIAAPRSTVTRVPNAGHLVHFDQPEVVRSIAVRAGNDG